MDKYLAVREALRELPPERRHLLMLDLLFDGAIDRIYKHIYLCYILKSNRNDLA